MSAIEIQMETRSYRLTGMTPLLGSNPANPEIHSRFVASKAATLQRAELETDMLPDDVDEKMREIKEQGLTVFLRNNKGQLVVGNHAIKGYFKDVLNILKGQLKLTNVKKTVDNLLFVNPDFVPVCDGSGTPAKEPDTINERSLKAETMRGPRMTLAASEQIDTPWTLEFSVTLVNDVKGEKAKGAALSWAEVETALTYGALKGLGQWRNGGYGKFTWKRVD